MIYWKKQKYSIAEYMKQKKKPVRLKICYLYSQYKVGGVERKEMGRNEYQIRELWYSIKIENIWKNWSSSVWEVERIFERLITENFPKQEDIKCRYRKVTSHIHFNQGAKSHIHTSTYEDKDRVFKVGREKKQHRIVEFEKSQKKPHRIEGNGIKHSKYQRMKENNNNNKKKWHRILHPARMSFRNKAETIYYCQM